MAKLLLRVKIFLLICSVRLIRVGTFLLISSVRLTYFHWLFSSFARLFESRWCLLWGYDQALTSLEKHSHAKVPKRDPFVSKILGCPPPSNVRLIFYWLGGTRLREARIPFIVDELTRSCDPSISKFRFDKKDTVLPCLYPVLSNYDSIDPEQAPADSIYAKHFAELGKYYQYNTPGLGSVPINFEYATQAGVLSCNFDFKSKRCAIQLERKSRSYFSWFSFSKKTPDNRAVVEKALEEFQSRYPIDITYLIKDGFSFVTAGDEVELLFKAKLTGKDDYIPDRRKLSGGTLVVNYDRDLGRIYLWYEQNLIRMVFEEIQYWIFGKDARSHYELYDACARAFDSIEQSLTSSGEERLQPAIAHRLGRVFKRGIVRELFGDINPVTPPIDFEHATQAGVLSCNFDFKSKRCTIRLKRKSRSYFSWFSFSKKTPDNEATVEKASEEFRARYPIDVEQLIDDGFCFETAGHEAELLFKAKLTGKDSMPPIREKLSGGTLVVNYDPDLDRVYLWYEQNLIRKVFEEIQYWIFGENTRSQHELYDACRSACTSIRKTLQARGRAVPKLAIGQLLGRAFERGLMRKLFKPISSVKAPKEKVKQLQGVFNITQAGTMIKIKEPEGSDLDESTDANCTFAPVVSIKIPEKIPDPVSSQKELVAFVASLGVCEVRILNEKSGNEEFVSNLLTELKKLEYRHNPVAIHYYDYNPTKALDEAFLRDHATEVVMRTIGYNNPNINKDIKTLSAAVLKKLKTNINRNTQFTNASDYRISHINLLTQPAITVGRLARTVYNAICKEVTDVLLFKSITGLVRQLISGPSSFSDEELKALLRTTIAPFAAFTSLLATVPLKLLLLALGARYLKLVKADETLFDNPAKVNACAVVQAYRDLADFEKQKQLHESLAGKAPADSKQALLFSGNLTQESKRGVASRPDKSRKGVSCSNVRLQARH